MDNVGFRIKMRRLELGMSQSDLAKRMGYTSKTAISKVERTDEDMSMARIKKFAQALDCTPGYLLGWEDTKERQGTRLSTYESEINKMVSKLSESQTQQLIAVMKVMFPEVR